MSSSNSNVNYNYQITKEELIQATKMFQQLEKRTYVSLKSMTPEERYEHRKLQNRQYTRKRREKQKEKEKQNYIKEILLKQAKQELDEKLKNLEQLKKQLIHT